MFISFLVCVMGIRLKFLAAQKPTFREPCLYALQLSNDGPAILDVPVSVSAVLDCADDEDSHLFVFEDDLQRKRLVRGHRKASANFTFTTIPGPRVVQVSAFILFPERARVASRNTTIEVYEYIPGRLEFSDIVSDSDGQLYAATGMPTNITIALECSHVLFQDAEFSYSWTIGDTRFTSSHNNVIHRFAEPGVQRVRAAVVARVPPFDDSNVTRYKWGYFDSQMNVKNPFKNINISGNTYLQHGQLLDLDILCSGSGPVDYCWKVLPPSENRTSLSCTDPVTVAECSFPIIYYFQESGDYLLDIFIDNVVSRQQRNVEIHIYDVSLRPQLSTVIIPLVCTILALLIIATALLIHLRRHRNYDIETADFDFMRADDTGSIVVETSWEHMHRTLLQLLRMPYIYYSTQIQLTNYGTVVREGGS